MGATEKVSLIGVLTIIIGGMITVMGLQFVNFVGRWNVSLGFWFLAIGLIVIIIGITIIMVAPDIGRKF
jgi:hypothetical protein